MQHIAEVPRFIEMQAMANNVRVEPVAVYNARKRVAYSEACKAWNPSTGGFPQIAFYLWFDEEGNEQTEGYIGSTERASYWAPTMRKALDRVLEASKGRALETN